MKILKNLKERRNLIKDLIERRDEVVKRTSLILNRKIPEDLLDSSFPDMMEWIISPLIHESFEEYKESPANLRRKAESIVYSIIKDLKDDNKNNNKDNNKDIKEKKEERKENEKNKQETKQETN